MAQERPFPPAFPANDAEKGVLSAYLYACYERCLSDEVASEATPSLSVYFAPDNVVTREAAKIIQGLAEGIKDETLRSRFLAGPQIHPVLQHAQRLATSIPDDHTEPGGL